MIPTSMLDVFRIVPEKTKKVCKIYSEMFVIQNLIYVTTKKKCP